MTPIVFLLLSGTLAMDSSTWRDQWYENIPGKSKEIVLFFRDETGSLRSLKGGTPAGRPARLRWRLSPALGNLPGRQVNRYPCRCLNHSHPSASPICMAYFMQLGPRLKINKFSTLSDVLL